MSLLKFTEKKTSGNEVKNWWKNKKKQVNEWLRKKDLNKLLVSRCLANLISELILVRKQASQSPNNSPRLP